MYLNKVWNTVFIFYQTTHLVGISLARICAVIPFSWFDGRKEMEKGARLFQFSVIWTYGPCKIKPSRCRRSNIFDVESLTKSHIPTVPTYVRRISLHANTSMMLPVCWKRSSCSKINIDRNISRTSSYVKKYTSVGNIWSLGPSLGPTRTCLSESSGFVATSED